jgi:hypothetical protein
MAIINKYITFVSLNSLVGLSPLCQASTLGQASAFDQAVLKKFLFTEPASKPPSKCGGGGSRRRDAVPAVEGWRNVDEMKADVRDDEERGFNKAYTDLIQEKIEATANVQVENSKNITAKERERIDDAICMLWECENSLTNINFPKEIQKKIDELLTLIENEMNKLAKNIYESQNKDYTDLALFMAFLHTNIKKYNAFFNFGAAVESALALYERTEDIRIKDIIKRELQGVECDDDTFGPYAEKIEEFSESLKGILAELR